MSTSAPPVGTGQAGPDATALDNAGKPIPGAPTSFKSDSLWSYELGYKANLMDRHLSIEAAVYDVEWKDIQPIAIATGTIIGNAGRARVKGAELFTRYRLTDAWSLDGSVSAIDAMLTENAPALGPAGSRLPNSAHFAATLGTTDKFVLADRPAYAGANVRYVGQRNAGFDSAQSSQPNFRMPAYVVADLQGESRWANSSLACMSATCSTAAPSSAPTPRSLRSAVPCTQL